MENNLIYTTRSRQDLDDIWDYISFDLQNLPSAERILNRIMDAAEQLKLFPESGALLSSVAPLDHELYLDERFLVSGKYLILQVERDIIPDVVQVLTGTSCINEVIFHWLLRGNAPSFLPECKAFPSHQSTVLLQFHS